MSEREASAAASVRDPLTLIGAVAVALAIRTLLVQPFYVPRRDFDAADAARRRPRVRERLLGAG